MASWDEKRLGGHKRAQGYISSAGATLGIGALGAAGLKSNTARKGAVKLSRIANKSNTKAGGKIIRGRQKAADSATGLTIGSAGVGGIGGYNFAAIQSQEAKRSREKVKKNMTTSAWGIDHGTEISKAEKKDKYQSQRRVNTALGALPIGGTVAPAIHSGVKAKKGRKAGAAAVSGVSSLSGGLIGGVAGSALTRGSKGGMALGGMAGSAAGANIGHRANEMDGRYKKGKSLASTVNKSIWGADYSEDDDVSKGLKDLPFKAKGFGYGVKTGVPNKGGSQTKWKDGRWDKPYSAGEKASAPFKRAKNKTVDGVRDAAAKTTKTQRRAASGAGAGAALGAYGGASYEMGRRSNKK